MIVKNYPPFFESLHRPYHQPIKMTRWVCEFVASKTERVRNLNVQFYFQLLNRLEKQYRENDLEEYNGILSKNMVELVQNHLNALGLNKKEKSTYLNEVLKKQKRNEVEKNIYSSYKAASYYINLAKDKLKLVNNLNKLTQSGNALLAISTRSGVQVLTDKEKQFYFRNLIENDFLLIMSLCLFRKLEQKYSFRDTDFEYFDFIKIMYSIRHFSYNKISLGNYNAVRRFWIETLDLLDKNNNLRKRYLEEIYSDPILKEWYEVLNKKMNQYEHENFKTKRGYKIIREKFEAAYEINKDENSVQGYVNLYDIKKYLKISHKNYEAFLNRYYELEKAYKHIFFSNIVTSIDRRQRFLIRNLAVLNIKIISE